MGLINVADLPVLAIPAMLATAILFYALLSPLSAGAVRPRIAIASLVLAIGVNVVTVVMAHLLVTRLESTHVMAVDPYGLSPVRQDHAGAQLMGAFATLSILAQVGLAAFVAARRRHIRVEGRLL